MSFDSWNHIAVSRDGTTARLFINGALAQSSTDPDFVLSTPSSNAVNYGARYWGSYSRLLDGALDEMRYSDIARYTAPFSISTASAPHPTSGDNNAILLFNFDASDLANTTSANSYTATANGTLTYTNWDGLTEALPLPITYHRSLSVTTSGHTSKLSWATASEINNQGFEIQRSTDSKTWEKIGFVPGAGNSNKIQSYEFTDRQPASTNYYRLKQQDFDGHEKFSHIVSAFFAKANVSVYPNPVTDVLYVNSADESMAYRIFDITGKMMVAGTTNDGLVSVSSLSKGSYILNLTSKTGNLSLKFQVE
ncbi:MAG TPA: T9SS type A sorting domain-containing protein [Saprospiraceae bacterium]|nr:T9SS type A sorting domain-containing protein [Saprospiraceae bacterium]